MPQMNRMLISVFFLFLGLVLLGGCGSSPNSSSTTVSPVQAAHPAGWLPAGHVAAAESSLSSCTQCHGSDFSGGISTVACTKCHLGNEQVIHPLDWDNLVGTKHAEYVRSKGDSACSNIYCHGADLNGVSGSGPSCSSCHLGGKGSVHPQDWGSLAYSKHSAYVAQYGTAACSNVVCHGADLSGVTDSGPSCSSCHLGGPNSVHPQDWGALTYVRHMAYVSQNGTASCANGVCHGADLSGVTDSGPSCSSCHLGGPSSVHPPDWASDFLQHGTYVNTNGAGSCRNAVCHGPDLQGVAASGQSCFLCHQFSIP